MNNNYTLIQTKELADIASTGYLYSHKSGARIMHIKNDDENKVFCVSFKTPPQNEKGIPHILEHCVLAGSEKYTSKEPFNELVKGSLYTYLNAMTYYDKTMYPIASCNDKDFKNLMDVYLDAVFNPRIYERKQTFQQEGWHYHMENAEAELEYNGIVYNEMKGAYSDPYDGVDNAIKKALFPDTSYRYDSGGNPDSITELSFEELLDFHKKHYHPENSYIYFYGNMNIEDCFDKLDADYLYRFDKTGNSIEIATQRPFSEPVYYFDKYAISGTDDTAGKNYLASAYVINSEKTVSVELGMALEILGYILMSNNSSPLKKVLVEQGIGENISYSYSDSFIRPVFEIIVKNSKYKADKLKDIIMETLDKIAAEGIDENLVSSALSRHEFIFREQDCGRTPRGLHYIINAMCCWLYGGDPYEAFSPLKAVDSIKSKPKGYFEKLIKDYFLDNTHCAGITLEPEPGKNNTHDEEIKAELAEKKSKMSKSSIDEIVETTAKLKLYQETPDSPEDIATIPLLDISDIDKKAPFTDVLEKKIAENAVLHCPLETNGIVYTEMFFSIKSVLPHDLKYVNCLVHVLSKIATKKHSAEELNGLIDSNLGGLKFRFEQVNDTKGGFKPFVVLAAKALAEKTEMLFSISEEIINESVFTDKNGIKALLFKLKSELENEFTTRGDIIAVNRSFAYIGESGAYKDAVSGIGFYDSLSEILKDFDSSFDKLVNAFLVLTETIFNRNSLTFGITCNNSVYDRNVSKTEKFFGALKKFEDSTAGKEPKVTVIAPANANEAFIMPSQVMYNVTSSNFIKQGFKYGGHLRVLTNIMSNGYLFDEIRIKGGAYGCFANFSRNGLMYFASFRDPNIKDTFTVYDRTADFIKNFSADKTEMTKYILGAINALDQPLLPGKKGSAAFIRYFSGYGLNDIQRERDEILGCNALNIREVSELVRSCVNAKNICSFGSESLINNNKNLFNSIRKI